MASAAVTASQTAKSPALLMDHSPGKLYLSDATHVFSAHAVGTSYRLSERLRSSPHGLCRAAAEVGALHLRRVEQARTGSREHDAAAFHDVGVVGDLERLACVLLDQQDGLSFLSELPQRVKNPGHQLRRESERRLVHQQQP